MSVGPIAMAPIWMLNRNLIVYYAIHNNIPSICNKNYILNCKFAGSDDSTQATAEIVPNLLIWHDVFRSEIASLTTGMLY